MTGAFHIGVPFSPSSESYSRSQRQGDPDFDELPPHMTDTVQATEGILKSQALTPKPCSEGGLVFHCLGLRAAFNQERHESLANREPFAVLPLATPRDFEWVLLEVA